MYQFYLPIRGRGDNEEVDINEKGMGSKKKDNGGGGNYSTKWVDVNCERSLFKIARLTDLGSYMQNLFV